MAQEKQTLFKKIPAVDRLLLSPTVSEVSAIYPRDLILKAVNQVLDELRTRIRTLSETRRLAAPDDRGGVHLEPQDHLARQGLLRDLGDHLHERW